MAVPTSTIDNIIYKGVTYNHVDTIPITEESPELTLVTTGSGDFNVVRLRATNGEGSYDPNFRRIDQFIPIAEAQVDSTHFKVKLRGLSRFEVGSAPNTFYAQLANSDGTGTARTTTWTQTLGSGAEDSWQYLTGFILRDTLIAEFSSEDLAVITQDGAYKIAWEGAHEAWNQPYIITQIITGGDRNSSQLAYAEMLWRIVVHTPSLATAGQIENAIHKALARGTATINFSDVTQAGEIEEVTPVTDRYQVQKVPLYVSGGIYRIRLAKG